MQTREAHWPFNRFGPRQTREMIRTLGGRLLPNITIIELACMGFLNSRQRKQSTLERLILVVVGKEEMVTSAYPQNMLEKYLTCYIKIKTGRETGIKDAVC